MDTMQATLSMKMYHFVRSVRGDFRQFADANMKRGNTFVCIVCHHVLQHRLYTRVSTGDSCKHFVNI